MIPFSSPFDPTAVGFLEDLGIELYKTASAEIVDLTLIKEIGRTGKPIIMSTGMATLREAEGDGEDAAVRYAGWWVLALCLASSVLPVARFTLLTWVTVA